MLHRVPALSLLSWYASLGLPARWGTLAEKAMRLSGGTLGGWRCCWAPTSGNCGVVRNLTALQRSHPHVCKHREAWHVVLRARTWRPEKPPWPRRGCGSLGLGRWWCSAPLPAFSFCFSIQEAQKRQNLGRCGVECVKHDPCPDMRSLPSATNPEWSGRRRAWKCTQDWNLRLVQTTFNNENWLNGLESPQDVVKSQKMWIW